MILVRMPQASELDVARVAAFGREHGDCVCQTRLAEDRVLLLKISGTDSSAEKELVGRLRELPAVGFVAKIDTPFLLSAREAQAERTRLRIGSDLEIGSDEFVVMAGPCAVESSEQVLATAMKVQGSGARVLRGGAYKPRTSPFSFQGLGTKGLEILSAAGKASRLPVITELLDSRQIDEVVAHADIVQIGMRNALNYTLLSELGKHPARPAVLLKFGIGSSIPELLSAADYLLSGGNPNVMLCLRGNVGPTTHSRARLSLSDIPALRLATHLPIIVDPSHAAGRRDLVPAMCAGAMAAGADGLLIEVHVDPDHAFVDGPQSLTPLEFERLMQRLAALAPALGRRLPKVPSLQTQRGGHPFEDLGLEAPAKQGKHDADREAVC